MKILLLLFLTTSIFAQAFEFPSKSAKSAYKILIKAGEYYQFCKTCGDKKATLIQLSAWGYSSSGTKGTIQANGSPLDISNTYIKDGNEFKNLAILTGIPSVSPEILPKDALPVDTSLQESSEVSDISYLSVLEKSVLNELNLARTNPKEYANYISEMKQYFKGNLYSVPNKIPMNTDEGIAAVNEAIKVLQTMEPISALSSTKGMSLAAKDHVNDTGSSGNTGHTGKDGSSPFLRMNRYGKWSSSAGENISYGMNTAREIVIQLIVDDGVQNRGHRVNILNPKFQFVGISFGNHSKYKYMCVQTFAIGYTDN